MPKIFSATTSKLSCHNSEKIFLALQITLGGTTNSFDIPRKKIRGKISCKLAQQVIATSDMSCNHLIVAVLHDWMPKTLD